MKGKGKGELYTRPTSYEQDGDARKGLPDTIVSTINNGVDQSIPTLENEDEPELIVDVDGYMDHEHANGSDYVDQQSETGGALDGPYPDGPIHSSDTTRVPEQLVEREYAMDGLIDSINRMRAGPGDHPEDPTRGVDERGVPVDYTAAGDE